jgi:Protein of unknown function (DUF2474)
MQRRPSLFVKQLAWMAFIWVASVLALGLVAELIRLWLR